MKRIYSIRCHSLSSLQSNPLLAVILVPTVLFFPSNVGLDSSAKRSLLLVLWPSIVFDFHSLLFTPLAHCLQSSPMNLMSDSDRSLHFNVFARVAVIICASGQCISEASPNQPKPVSHRPTRPTPPFSDSLSTPGPTPPALHHITPQPWM